MGYPNDLTDKKMALVEHHFDTGNYGNRRENPKKILINAVFFINKNRLSMATITQGFSQMVNGTYGLIYCDMLEWLDVTPRSREIEVQYPRDGLKESFMGN